MPLIFLLLVATQLLTAIVPMGAASLKLQPTRRWIRQGQISNLLLLFDFLVTLSLAEQMCALY